MKVGTARSLGVHGGAINLSGDDFVNVPPLGIHGKLTIAAWVNLHALGADRNNILRTGRENGPMAAAISRKGEMCFTANGLSWQSSGILIAAADLGKWRHLAYVYDGVARQVSFYIDGRLEGTRGSPIQPVWTSTPA